jgi:site-specific recombinase XerD
MMPARVKCDSPVVSYDLLASSFCRSLEAANKSTRTVQTYLDAIRRFGEFLKSHGMPTAPSGIAREHLEAFIADQLMNWKPATANNRYRALQQFFKWLEVEGEITDSPMRHMNPPKVPEAPPDVLGEMQLRKLLKTCDGKEFADRRDKAILLLFVDTGMRRSELAGLTVDAIDFEHNFARVLGKGGGPAPVHLAEKRRWPLTVTSGRG